MKYFRATALAVAVIAFSSAVFITLFNETTTPKQPPSQIVVTPANEQKAEPSPIKAHYFVKVGDTLSDIFSSWGIPYSKLQGVLEADLSHLQLDTIKPGDHLEFIIDSETRELLSLTYHLSLVERATYRLDSEGNFEYQFEEEQGEWHEVLYSGTINGSFSLSAHKTGLTSNQIANITRVLKDKINFSRTLRAGDRFDVLINRQFLGDHPTGNSEIQAVSFQLSGREVSAYLANDGRFYDRDGQSLERAFNRYPIDKQYRRITSAFNPKRKHPVTGRISPHNGTDFATPVGAPIYSTGDGRVVGVRNHPYAGKYLVIEHNSVYTTRYLHLSKFLVKKGQQVKRGQKIALSGATGRLTGPHLHFEVLVRNRAVDPMKADLPLASSIAEKDKAAFKDRIAAFDTRIESHKLEG
ncbi:peptidoglycan DD-metalloendopeptidase family protein [Vibrio sp. TBV020]|uniref:peptidoglycan DD-metalloendopeptidase family protein n=1 Tax=Vibrio sp. TBV020 TaxID=3137398 RepID=UPI0038CD28E8